MYVATYVQNLSLVNKLTAVHLALTDVESTCVLLSVNKKDELYYSTQPYRKEYLVKLYAHGITF